MKLLALFFLFIASSVNGQTILATTTTCTQATINAGTAGCAIFNANGLGSVGIQITGTWTGTITFSTSVLTGGVGATFVTSLVTPVGATTPVSTTTGNGAWSLAVAGFSQVKVAVTSAGSGSAIVTIRGVQQARGSGGGSSGGGGGSVTSVGLSAPDIVTVSGSPVTTTGTLSFTPTDPNADRIVFWDDSAGKWVYLTAGSGLDITGTTLTATLDTSAEVIALWTGTCNSTSVLGADGICSIISSGFDVIESGTNTTASMIIGAGASLTTLSTGILGVDGVTMTGDGDGAITTCGIGDGSDECLTFNYDDTANTVVVSSSTGVDEIQLTNPIELITFTGNGEIEALGSGDLSLSADGDDIFLGTGNTSIELYDGTGNINVLQGATNVFQFKSMGGIKVEFDYGSNANNFYLSTTSFNGAGSFYVAGIITADKGIIVGGSTPSVANVGMDSCGTTAASITGNSNSGRITVGATVATQCRVTTPITAPNGWQCAATAVATNAALPCVGIDTTHFDILGTITASTVVQYIALPN